MKCALATGILALLAGPPVQAQVTIVNPENLDVPKDKVDVLYRLAAETVAKEFHVPHSSALELPVTLILGDPADLYTADDEKGVYNIHLTKWNENGFTASAMMLMLHRLLSRPKLTEMVMDVRRRSDKIAPVTLSELRKRR